MEKTQGLQWETKMENEMSIKVVKKNINRYNCYGKASLFGLWEIGIVKFGTIKWNFRHQAFCFESSWYVNDIGANEVKSLAKAIEDIETK